MLENTVLTPQEVAEMLKIAKNTVYELIKRGELNGYKVGKKIRVDLKDVEIYKNKTKNNSTDNFNSVKNDKLASLNIFDPQNNSNSSELVICGQDVLLDILSRYIEFHSPGIRTFRSYVGSYNGLLALYLGKVQVATSHLWDGDTNQYNIPFVRRLVPGIPTVIIHLACRMEGFYVQKGNPKNIKTWEDLKRPDISIINREKGCGVRILLDEHLRLLKIEGTNISGYNRECFSHLAAASNVARGGADAAIGNEKTSLQVKNIDFIPLQKERYELVLKKEDLNKPLFKSIINILRSDEFKSELLGIGGYDLTETGNIIAEL
ncbi:substrate-binding domain-containing protein [Clostridium tyrobutyricum]|uniref:substrate-binding domain-containing protein n=1 Tax=Clostridium tyrobutyricum TaxID=1519 RepID=UPI001C3DFB97|nr:helix-turn-helix transcriptional regulator [Clostridium tyrobutyricum]MBV4438189.1 helix-turn-helix transcriptional regulator [Clostridium tyrobutyricum]